MQMSVVLASRDTFSKEMNLLAGMISSDPVSY